MVTRPRGARLDICLPISKRLLFQSTRPRGARQKNRTVSKLPQCFNPRAREGRDEETYLGFRATRVSIHAPAKGATLRRHHVCHCYPFQSTRPRRARQKILPSSSAHKIVSIHAPAKGATSAPAARESSSSSFNPRAREGRDTHFQDIERMHIVSIHAPARGATALQL